MSACAMTVRLAGKHVTLSVTARAIIDAQKRRVLDGTDEKRSAVLGLAMSTP